MTNWSARCFRPRGRYRRPKSATACVIGTPNPNVDRGWFQPPIWLIERSDALEWRPCLNGFRTEQAFGDTIVRRVRTALAAVLVALVAGTPATRATRISLVPVREAVLERISASTVV